MKHIFLILILTALYCVQNCVAQNNSQPKDYATQVFRGTLLINSPTTEMIEPHSFSFSIRHRFGEIAPDNSLLKQFLGTDETANIRFIFEMPLGKFVNIGLGRTKFGKTYDFESKLLFCRQVNSGFPFSGALHFNMAYMSDDFPAVEPNSYFTETDNPFRYHEFHRLSYTSRLILSRKFTDKFSAMIIPAYVYKNLTTPGFENGTGCITAGMRYKTSLKSSFICEGTYVMNNRPEKYLWPVAFGWEVGTSGHVFQIIVSSTNEMIPSQEFTAAQSDYTNGKFILGFNLKRTFWSKKYHK